MCGRFTLTAPPEAVREAFGLEDTPELAPRWNVAPGQEVATVDAGEGDVRRLAMRRWGLVPFWAKDAKIGARLVNARSETAHEKPAYREAFERRRCLVPADGFYEWAAGGRGPKQPFWIARRDGACFGIAGLWERWRDPEGGRLETCVLLTAAASPGLARIHDRVPVIVPRAAWRFWLDPAVRDPRRLRPLLVAAPERELAWRAVSRRVNRPEHDDAGCIAPEAAEAPA